jgi:hypothetical protein
MVPETIGSCPIIRVVSMARRNTQLRPVATTAITGQVTCPVTRLIRSYLKSSPVNFRMSKKSSGCPRSL